MPLPCDDAAASPPFSIGMPFGGDSIPPAPLVTSTDGEAVGNRSRAAQDEGVRNVVGAASEPDAPGLLGSEQILEGTGWGQPEPVSDWGGEGGAFTYSQDLREQQWRGGGSWEEEEEEQEGTSGGQPQAWTTRSNYAASGGDEGRSGASSSGREFFAEAGPRGGGSGGGGGGEEDGQALPGQERPPYGAELLPSDIVILSRRDMVRVHP